MAEGVDQINSALSANDPAALLESLNNSYVGLENVQEAQAVQYLALMNAAAAAKVEVHIVIIGVTYMYTCTGMTKKLN